VQTTHRLDGGGDLDGLVVVKGGRGAMSNDTTVRVWYSSTVEY